MRIKQLNLSRYGHFTDFLLNFGDQDSTENIEKTSDLHIIYGPNEAGKSTTLSAIVDLLYGMPTRSKYNFIHNYQTMAIEATLEQNQHQLKLRRYKNKLTDEKNQTLPAAAIDTHGLNREDFKSRFSFDEETLKEGGESILQNNGDLGAALFAATSGIADFSESLSKLMQPANAFYEPGKTKDKALFILKEELKLIDDKRKELDINATAWAKHIEQATTLKSRHSEFRDIARANRLQLETLKQKQLALKTVTRIQSLRSSINALPAMPEAPSNWLTSVRELVKQQYSHNIQCEQQNKQISELLVLQSGITINAKLVTHASNIEKLRSDRALFEQRSVDIESLKQESADLTQQQQQLLSQLDINEPQCALDYILPDSLIAQLVKLHASHAQIQSSLATAKKEQTSTKTELNAINFNKDDKEISVDALINCISLAQENAFSVRFKQLQEQLVDTQNQLNENLSALNPWRGSIEQIMEQSVPSTSHIQNVQAKLSAINSAIAVSEAGIKSSNDERSNLSLNDTALLGDFTGDSLESGRADRDKLIHAHLGALDEEKPHAQLHKTARDIALQQQQLDQLADQQISLALQQGQTDATQSRFKSLTEHSKKLQSQLVDQHKTQEALLAELSKIALALQLHNAASAQEIMNWLGLREVAVASAHRLNIINGEIELVSKEMHIECERLKTLIQSIDNDVKSDVTNMSEPAEVLSFAQSIAHKQQKKNTALQQTHDNFLLISKKLTIRESDVSAAQNDIEQWQSQWTALLEPTWINTTDAVQVGPILSRLSELSALQIQLDATMRRQDTLHTDQVSYQQRVSEVLSSLDKDSNGSLPEQLNSLFADHAQTIEANTKLKRIAEQINTAKQNLQTAEGALLPISKQLSDMSAHCEVEDSTELENRLEQIKEKQQKLASLHDYEQELQAMLTVDSIEEAMEQLVDMNEHELPALISEQELKVDSDTQTLSELHHEYRSVQDPLDRFQADSNVAQLNQERQNILLQIEDKAMQTMRARLGKLALEQGVRHFRDQRRSTMLKNASRAFVTITGGNYVDLLTQPSKQGNSEDLVGIRDTGHSKLASDMSSGTRAQLYLALRIAAYEDYCKTRTPLPFIADDIMETFDEKRTEATLSILNDMGQHGQIMYLTHHRHVVDIARQSLGKSVNIHELPANPLSTELASNSV